VMGSAELPNAELVDTVVFDLVEDRLAKRKMMHRRARGPIHRKGRNYKQFYRPLNLISHITARASRDMRFLIYDACIA
jgi:hypothetical protein